MSLPIASVSLKPNNCSAAELNYTMTPTSSITIIASGTVARIEWRSASLDARAVSSVKRHAPLATQVVA